MKSMRIAMTFAWMMLFPALSMADVILPLGHDLFSFDYDRIYRQGVAGRDVAGLPPTGPFSLDHARRLSGTSPAPALTLFADNVNDGSDPRVRLLGIPTEKLRAVRSLKPDDLPSLIAGLVYRPNDYFGALSLFALDRAKAIDPTYTGKKYRGLAGGVETAGLFYSRGKVALALARQRIYWGPQRINLLISETAEPLDLLSAAYNTKRFALSFLFARLDISRPDGLDSLRYPDRTFVDNRYLVGHRLDLNLHRRLRLGLFETVVFGGEGRPPELYYLNPLQFFHAAQLNENQNDNTIVGLDAVMLPGKGVCLYGQLLIDDFQIDDTSPGDNEPNEIAWMAGLFTVGQAGTMRPDVRLEYVRIANRTYHQREPQNRYLYHNRLIGHPLGPDADSISLMVRFLPTAGFFAELELAYRRNGEGSIYRSWDEPWLSAAGEYEESFPTGVVEQARLLAGRLRGYPPVHGYIQNHFFVALEAGWGEIRNFRHIADQTATTAWFNLSVSWLGAFGVAVE